MATSAIPTLHDVDPTEGEKPLPRFKNEAFLNFGNNDVKRAMQEALRDVEGQLGHEYTLVIGGERVSGSAKIRSVNPARPA
jgi:1-pyrroline-5-carboxylate dehydrogenase